jgi:hypothetical protein
MTDAGAHDGPYAGLHAGPEPGPEPASPPGPNATLVTRAPGESAPDPG